MQFSINRITNANVYLNGSSLLGKTEEISLGPVKYIMSEHKALGMVGKMEFFSGVDKIEAKIKWNSFYKDVLVQVGNPVQFNTFQVRGSVSQYDSGGLNAEKSLVAYMVGSFKDFPLGMFKQHDNVELETEIAVFYVKLEEDGQAIYEFDATANIFRVNGVDIMAQYRANLGI